MAFYNEKHSVLTESEKIKGRGPNAVNKIFHQIFFLCTCASLHSLTHSFIHCDQTIPIFRGQSIVSIGALYFQPLNILQCFTSTFFFFPTQGILGANEPMRAFFLNNKICTRKKAKHITVCGWHIMPFFPRIVEHTAIVRNKI